MERSKMLRLFVASKDKIPPWEEASRQRQMLAVCPFLYVHCPSTKHQDEFAPSQHVVWDMGCGMSQTATLKLWESFNTTRTCLPHLRDNHGPCLKISR